MLARVASVRTKSKKSCRFVKISLGPRLPVPTISVARAAHTRWLWAQAFCKNKNTSLRVGDFHCAGWWENRGLGVFHYPTANGHAGN